MLKTNISPFAFFMTGAALFCIGFAVKSLFWNDFKSWVRFWWYD